MLIIGGGTCGLTIAQGLQKVGSSKKNALSFETKHLENQGSRSPQNEVSSTIFERDSQEDYQNKTRDWGKWPISHKVPKQD